MPAPRVREQKSSATNDGPKHEDCWAKTIDGKNPGINVRNHCLNVGCVARALLSLLPPQLQALIPPGAVTLAALHDIGKVSPGFQVKSETWLAQRSLRERAWVECWSAGESDHAKTSQFTVQQLLSNSKLDHWAAAVGAHHGQIQGERVHVHELWEQERVRLAKELIEIFGPLPIQTPTDAAVWFLAGLITVSDWIGSDEDNFPQDAHWDLAERRNRARKVLNVIGWTVPAIRRQLNGFNALFPEIPTANSLQVASMEMVREPGIYIIEGPMGYGKTEAALAAAYQLIRDGKASGLYFGLPTQVTSNRIHERVQPWVSRISSQPQEVRLCHSTSWLSEEPLLPELHPAVKNDLEAKEHARAGYSWFASAKRTLLAPFGVGTIDQALLGIVAAKHFFVRQFGLAGKVVILDEVHTYDLYTSTLIGQLVKRLLELRCTVIILSATLTESRRRELLGLENAHPVSDGYPLVSGIAGSLIERSCEPPPPKTIRIRNISGAWPIEETLERARRDECVLWIRNTVDEAQETYRALQSANLQGGPRIALLHSRFPFFRRDQLEREWMACLGKDATNRPDGCVLVSTQVAEQSVDIDADLLITDLAPTDMLLQRLGRLWRHDRPARPCSHPEVWVVTPAPETLFGDEKELCQALGKSAKVYDPYVLLRSFQQWNGRNEITLPGEIRSILEATYKVPDAPEPRAWQVLRERLESKKEEMARRALNSAMVWGNPSLDDEEGLQTRYITYPTTRLLVVTSVSPLNPHRTRINLLNGEEVEIRERDKKNADVAKAIFRNLVPVPLWAAKDGLNHKLPLTNYVSQSVAVGMLRVDGGICWLDDDHETGLCYDPDQGIAIHRPQKVFDESYD